MNFDDALALLLASLAKAIKVSNMILAARAEGRTSLNLAELDELAIEDDDARRKLQTAIDEANASG